MKVVAFWLCLAIAAAAFIGGGRKKDLLAPGRALIAICAFMGWALVQPVSVMSAWGWARNMTDGTKIGVISLTVLVLGGATMALAVQANNAILGNLPHD